MCTVRGRGVWEDQVSTPSVFKRCNKDNKFIPVRHHKTLQHFNENSKAEELEISYKTNALSFGPISSWVKVP